MKKLLLAVAVALPALLSGCAAGLMRDASSQQISPPNPERAKVVFMRSSMVAGAIGCDLFEVVNGELRFIGQLPTGNKIVFETTPGEKVFMAYGTAADFMLANLAGGKTYYSIVRPNWGTGGFAPTPIRTMDANAPRPELEGVPGLAVGHEADRAERKRAGMVWREQEAPAGYLRGILGQVPEEDPAGERGEDNTAPGRAVTRRL